MKTVEELFDYNSKQKELTDFFNNIKDTYVKPKYSSIPREYYPYLYKLLSYRIYDKRGDYKEGDIRTFFVAKDAYKNNSIAFYDNDGNFYFLGTTNAIKEWQKQKNLYWDNMLHQVTQICRNIVRPEIKKMKDSIVFPCKCEITGEIIESPDNLHIDHYDKDFSQVVFDWLYALKKYKEKKDKKTCDIVGILYNNFISFDNNMFTYDKLNESFLLYHNSNTHLRKVTKKANLSKEKIRPEWDRLKVNGYYIEKYRDIN